jgi:hypothetical protein
MDQSTTPIFAGDSLRKIADQGVSGGFVTLCGEPFYKIQHYNAMEPFFMSLVSGSNHWLFIASTGGISAGRTSAEQALFPYYTVDKLTENNENTGSKTILLVTCSEKTSLWEPFSDRQAGIYGVERDLYKNIPGTELVFEERNLDLGLTFRYAWRTGEKFGFIKTAALMNDGEASCRVDILDGLQNILPANVTQQTQNTFGSLLDAYKRGELDKGSGLAIFSLSSVLTDLAEPSESLLATTVGQAGLDRPDYLLSSLQLDAFRAGKGIVTEAEICGQRSAYFVRQTVDLAPQEEKTWHLFADVLQDGPAVAEKLRWLAGDREQLLQALEADAAANRAALDQFISTADGLQLSREPLLSGSHFANVMFNTMRGGVFIDGYAVRKKDLRDFVNARNRHVMQSDRDFLDSLPEKIHVADLKARVEASGSADLIRLVYSYLPLTFSRRHGDPSRPWNRFAIRLKQPDGSLKIDYEGNWRDIFQNWEALAYSYPEFTESMIASFLNATTVDGYNPYRVTHLGVDWEVPEPGNPWANIGYWSDHQIIYLQKLMEISAQVHPGRLETFLQRRFFTSANVPYRIAPYASQLEDPYNTIAFDWDLERRIARQLGEIGTDARLVFGPDGELLRSTLAEKLLTLLLAKLSNFVPEGGIWMNTQRPEWNDANNALVGKGLSVVTLAYLRRYVAFCRGLFAQSGLDAFDLSHEIRQWVIRVSEILERHSPVLQGAFSDTQRRGMMDELGAAGSDYRWGFYRAGLTGKTEPLSGAQISRLLDLAQQYIDHSLRANRREDALYHAYNILHLAPGTAQVSRLSVMLEGQVAVLSSGLLSAAESLALLTSLRDSPLYQAGTRSYILYPDRKLPGFLEKNRLTQDQICEIPLFVRLEAAGDRSIVTRDVDGAYHFSGQFRNFKDVDRRLAELRSDPRFAALVEADFQKIEALFEATFHHSEFTGRSGTFFAYEGLGSVYWHMVAKLLLAAQETLLRFKDTESAAGLLERYRDIAGGLGYHKTAAEYGAFPTDPYSHTPKGQGAKQPGMTGMVKELILTRQAEVGFRVDAGRLVFDPLLVDTDELLAAPASFKYLTIAGQPGEIELDAGTLAYTICQTPVILRVEGKPMISVHFADGTVLEIDGRILDEANSQHIFLRDGKVHHLTVSI